MIERIVSGGQTGADRAALDVAIEFGIPLGAWVPSVCLLHRLGSVIALFQDWLEI